MIEAARGLWPVQHEICMVVIHSSTTRIFHSTNRARLIPI